MESKKIILGVSGGIAAYKACDLASLLTKDNLQVHTVLTGSAEQFIRALSFKTITYNQVYTDQFNYGLVEPLHIELCRNADLLLIAPATADIIAKLAGGICDDLLTTIACAYKGPVLLAPAMNTQMWENPITQENLKKVKEVLGCQVLEPVTGELACRTIGMGKLAPVEAIAEAAKSLLSGHPRGLLVKDGHLNSLKVLITAGGTREPIDPVRFIGNRSSGKMGLALADEAYERGADVTLITTAPVKRPYEVIEVETAHQLQGAVEEHFDASQILIMAAAVSDFKPIQVFTSKIKKTSAESDWNLPLTRSPDILETLGRLKKPKQVLIGFAAESENLLKNARKKLENKKLDMIVANEVRPEIGFASDYNEVYLLTRQKSEAKLLPKAPKELISKQIWSFVEEKFLA
jgi:phosphopantothenoylcysteine decarboxylase / phosphopantothenate---cysteine ligase